MHLNGGGKIKRKEGDSMSSVLTYSIYGIVYAFAFQTNTHQLSMYLDYIERLVVSVVVILAVVISTVRSYNSSYLDLNR